MACEQREALSQHICNFYCHTAKKSVKTTVDYFKKQNIPQTTVYCNNRCKSLWKNV